MRKGEHEAFVAAFLDQVRRDRGLPGNAFNVVYAIAQHFNRETREAWPSQDTLMAITNLSENTIKRMVACLRERGHLLVDPGTNRGRSSRYRAIIKGIERGPHVDPFTEAKRGPVRKQKGSNPDEKGVQFGRERGPPLDPDLKRPCERPYEKKKDAAYAARDLSFGFNNVQGKNHEDDQAPDPSIAERELFRRGKDVLGKSAGRLIRDLLRAKGGNVALARAAIEQASTKQTPREYVARIIHGPPANGAHVTLDQHGNVVARGPDGHLTAKEEHREKDRQARAALKASIARDQGGEPPDDKQDDKQWN